MKKWAFLVFAEEYIDGVGVFEVFEVLTSESEPTEKPKDYIAMLNMRFNQYGDNSRIPPPEYYSRWSECPVYTSNKWFCVSGVYLSSAALERCKRIGRLDVSAQPRFQTFRVFSFFGMDNYRIGDVKLDIDNHTLDDLKKFAVSHYQGRFSLGITAGAGDEDGLLRLYRSIAHLAYTTILSSSDISTPLANKTGDWDHFKNLLWAAVTTSHTIAKVPENQKVPLTGNKLMSEYNLDPSFPIVAMWALDPAPHWSPDWKQEAFDQFMDLVGDAAG